MFPLSLFLIDLSQAQAVLVVVPIWPPQFPRSSSAGSGCSCAVACTPFSLEAPNRVPPLSHSAARVKQCFQSLDNSLIEHFGYRTLLKRYGTCFSGAIRDIHPRSAVGHSSWERYGALLAEIRDLNRCAYACIIFVHLFRSAALHQRLVGSGREREAPS